MNYAGKADYRLALASCREVFDEYRIEESELVNPSTELPVSTDSLVDYLFEIVADDDAIRTIRKHWPTVRSAMVRADQDPPGKE